MRARCYPPQACGVSQQPHILIITFPRTLGSCNLLLDCCDLHRGNHKPLPNPRGMRQPSELSAPSSQLADSRIPPNFPSHEACNRPCRTNKWPKTSRTQMLAYLSNPVSRPVFYLNSPTFMLHRSRRLPNPKRQGIYRFRLIQLRKYWTSIGKDSQNIHNIDTPPCW